MFSSILNAHISGYLTQFSSSPFLLEGKREREREKKELKDGDRCKVHYFPFIFFNPSVFFLLFFVFVAIIFLVLVSFLLFLYQLLVSILPFFPTFEVDEVVFSDGTGMSSFSRCVI